MFSLPIEMNRVLLTGASGPIGAALLPSLERAGTHVMRLVRGQPKAPNEITWDPLCPVAPDLVSDYDAVIHMAGEPVVGRWSVMKKKNIRDSRVLGTRHLATALANSTSPPKVFICTSGVGFYGNRRDEVLTEQSSSGTGFLADVSREWEAASHVAGEAGIRTVNLRIGLMLSAEGGALPKMLTPFRFGVGGRIGSGNQWCSWIHIDDLVGAIHHVLRTDSLSGPVNLVSPNPVTNHQFTDALAQVLRRPAVLLLPEFVARLLLGEMAEELLLSSQRVRPQKLENTGYRFRFLQLYEALHELLS